MALLAHALFLVAIVLPGCAAVAARTGEERGIAATGTGRIHARPDVAAVALGGEVRTASLADATAQVDRRMRDILARLKGLGVRQADVQTTSDRIGPIAEAQERGGAGANVIRDVQFTLDDPRRSEAEARALAVPDAQEKAREVAAAAGVRVGRLLSVSESSPVRPVARMSLATGPGPLEPGELDVVVTLEMRYAIEQ